MSSSHVLEWRKTFCEGRVKKWCSHRVGSICHFCSNSEIDGLGMRKLVVHCEQILSSGGNKSWFDAQYFEAAPVLLKYLCTVGSTSVDEGTKSKQNNCFTGSLAMIPQGQIMVSPFSIGDQMSELNTRILSHQKSLILYLLRSTACWISQAFYYNQSTSSWRNFRNTSVLH